MFFSLIIYTYNNNETFYFVKLFEICISGKSADDLYGIFRFQKVKHKS